MIEESTTPRLWLIDSDRKPLAECLAAFRGWSDALYLGPDAGEPDWNAPPDAVFFSAEINGGADGEAFARLCEAAAGIPLLAVARLRSLTQALAFFRAGVDDYLPLPLDGSEARTRLEAVLDRIHRRALESVLIEVEPLDPEPVIDGAGSAVIQDVPETPTGGDCEDEPEPVDGLPIPTLWEELPCGLLVFDSVDNLVFANSLGLELFGRSSLAELQDAFENRPSAFAAHAANNKPLSDNQWPQVLARKTRTARSAVVSVERPSGRRAWLRIDCLPHLSEGKVNRLSMTVVNLTGELPPLKVSAGEEAEVIPLSAKRDKRRGRLRRKGR